MRNIANNSSILRNKFKNTALLALHRLVGEDIGRLSTAAINEEGDDIAEVMIHSPCARIHVVYLHGAIISNVYYLGDVMSFPVEGCIE